jgi:transaldolase
VAIANARSAYRRYRERFTDERWLTLHDAGANPQRPLWASTGTKDAAYSDVLYVDELIAPDAINTMPEATLRAFADHGDPGASFDWRSGDAEETLRRARAAGVDLDAITTQLEREGVESFCRSYEELLDCIERKLDRVPVEAGTRGGP